MTFRRMSFQNIISETLSSRRIFQICNHSVLATETAPYNDCVSSAAESGCVALELRDKYYAVALFKTNQIVIDQQKCHCDEKNAFSKGVTLTV